MATPIQKLARRLFVVEQELRSRTMQPQLAYSSIDDGALLVKTGDETTMVIGEQYDGTATTTVVTGPPPPTPTAAFVSNETPGGLTVRWDGGFIDAVVAPMDFQRTTIHVIPVSDWDGVLDFQERDLPQGSISSGTGGQVWIPSEPGVEMAVILLAWSQAGKPSVIASQPTLGTSQMVGLDTNSPEWQDLMAQAQAAATAAQQAQAASLAAQQAADTAASTADDAGLLAAQAIADAATAQQAAATAQALADAAASPEDLANATAAAATAATAAASAAQQAADAIAAAQAAAEAAEAAGANATSALASASGKNTVRYATFPPTNEPNTAGDTWFHRRAAAGTNEPIGTVVGQYEGTGGTGWVKRELSSGVFASIDAGKIVFGTMSGERIEAGTLVIGQVGGLAASLESKATPAQVEAARLAGEAYALARATEAREAAEAAAAADASTKAAAAYTNAAALAAAAQAAADANPSDADLAAAALAAQQAAVAAAAADATTKADAARQAAEAASATYAAAQASAAQQAAIAAAATDATTKASTAQQAAIAQAQTLATNAQNAATAAAALTAQSKVDTAKAEALTAAAVTAEQKAQAAAATAQAAATAAAAADATIKANNAKSEAVTVAQGYATTAQTGAQQWAASMFNGTKDLVTGWVVTGKTTINGGQIETDSILAGSIKAGEIDTKHLAAGAVTAITIDAQDVAAAIVKAGVIQSQLVMTGIVQVGAATWDTTNGLIIPQTDGGRVHFPVDGSAATIWAHLVARSLNVQDDLVISGYGEIKGEVVMANGVTRPTAKPPISVTWGSRAGSGMNGDVANPTTDNGETYCGLTNHHSNAEWMAVAVNFFGAGIRLLDKTSGQTVAYPDPTSSKPWCAEFYPEGGIVMAAGNYYLLGSDGKRNGDYYIYRIDTSWNKINEIKVGALNAFGGYKPRLGPADAASSAPALFWTAANGSLYMQTYPVNLGTTANPGTVLRELVVNAGRVHLGGAAWDTATGWLRVFSQAGASWTFYNTFARVTAIHDMPRAGGANIKGILYDAARTRFESFDNVGRIWFYGRSVVQTTVRAAYSWYDGEGTIRETPPSPEASLTLSPGQIPYVGLPPAPEEKITDPSRTDKANRIGVYVGTGANPLRLQMFTKVPVVTGVTVDADRYWSNDVITTNGKTPEVLNGFLGASISPGYFRSTAKRLDGSPKTDLDGAGQARLDGLIPPGFMMATTGNPADRTGWLVANGRALSVASYPDLAAEYDLGNGNYRWGGTVASGQFNLPASQQRIPVGAGGSKTHGGYGGSDTVDLVAANLPPHTHTIPAHTHDLGRSAAAGNSPNNIPYGTTTRATLASTGLVQEPANNTGAGTGLSGTPATIIPLYFGVTYMVKV